MGVAKSFIYPLEVTHLQADVGGTPFLIVKSDAHRGKGINFISRLKLGNSANITVAAGSAWEA